MSVSYTHLAVGELKQIGKPFIVVVNTTRPYAMETQELCRRKEEKYDIKCLPFNCDQLKHCLLYTSRCV